MKKLAILIPTLDSRVEQLHNLLGELDRQANLLGVTDDIVIIPNADDGTLPIGSKRNALLDHGTKLADYVAFFDDDDYPGDNYLKYILEGCDKGFDCCSLRGVMLTDGENPELFEHSIKYGAWATTDNHIKYERYPNHLNAIKSSIAKRFKFPETNHGEDKGFSDQVHRAGAIKSEYYIEEVIYVYQYNSTK